MPLLFPEPSPLPVALDIIREIKHNLSNRRYLRISRRVFLHRHGELRDKLSQTVEYHELRKILESRSGGICEDCQEKPAIHIAHVKPVVRFPDLALDPENCQHLCLDCHQKHHPNIKLS